MFRRFQQELLVELLVSLSPASTRARATEDNAHQVVLDLLAEAEEIVPNEVSVFLSENDLLVLVLL